MFGYGILSGVMACFVAGFLFCQYWEVRLYGPSELRLCDPLSWIHAVLVVFGVRRRVG